jgi:hypothetical protein
MRSCDGVRGDVRMGGCVLPIEECTKNVVDGWFRESGGKDLPMGGLLFKRRRDVTKITNDRGRMHIAKDLRV